MPFLNSFWASPRLRASFGQLRPAEEDEHHDGDDQPFLCTHAGDRTIPTSRAGSAGWRRCCECVVNVSEGRRTGVLDDLGGGRRRRPARRAPGPRTTTVPSSRWSARRRPTGRWRERRCAGSTCAAHHGVHPRLGVVDVVPFVPLAGSTMADAVAARDAFAAWAAAELGVPCFLYGPNRTRTAGGHAARSCAGRPGAPADPTSGPAEPHPTAGAMCVGARDAAGGLQRVAGRRRTWRSPAGSRRPSADPTCGRSASLVGSRAQVSMNLIDAAAARARPRRSTWSGWPQRPRSTGAELVGLVPQAVLAEAHPRPARDRARPAVRTGPTDRRPSRRGESGASGGDRAAGGLGPLAAQPAALPLRHAAPDPELLAVHQGVLEALHAHHAAPADLLGLPGRRAPLREEEVGIDPEAVGLGPASCGRRA